MKDEIEEVKKPVKMVLTEDNDTVEDTNDNPINNTEETSPENVNVEAIVVPDVPKQEDPYDSEEENILKELKGKDNLGIFKEFVGDDDIKDEIIALPTVPSNILYSYVQQSANIKKELYEKDINISHAVLTNLNTLPYAIEPGFFKTFVPNDNIKSKMSYKDKEVKFEEVDIVGGDKKRSAIDKIRKVTRVGKNIQAPLWNTGIRITFIVPPVNDVYELKKKLRDLNIESDIDSGGLLYSNKKIKLYKEITTFISNYILDTTLDIPEDKTLYDFVPIQDIALTIVGASISLYPNGNYVTVACSNTTVIKNNIPKCNFISNAKVDPRELVKIDSSRVTETMLEIISRRNTGSVSVEDLITYRNEYIKDENFNKIVVPYEDSELIFTLANPSISTFIRRGDKWYDDLLSKLYNVGNLTAEAKKDEIDKIIELSVLGTYNSYITSIIVDGETFDDEEAIDEMLNEVSQDNYLYNIYIKHIMNFISYNTIANIGTNNFICPTCNERQKEETNYRQIFEMEYIWMDPIAYFLEIMNSKLTKLQKRTAN